MKRSPKYVTPEVTAIEGKILQVAFFYSCVKCILTIGVKRGILGEEKYVLPFLLCISLNQKDLN